MAYLAFISYKHVEQTDFVESLELDLKRYAKPFWRPPSRIFRDEKFLRPGPDLPQLIRNALEKSRYLIYVASPQAAMSQWVQSELDIWCRELRRENNLIVVLTDGTIATQVDGRTLDWNATTALPKNLMGMIVRIPLYVDLTWISEGTQSLANPSYKDIINALVARLREIDPIDLAGEEILQHRRTRRAIWSAFVTLSSLLGIAIFAGTAAYQNSIRAEEALVRADKEAKRAFETLVDGVSELTSVSDLVIDSILARRIAKSESLKFLSAFEDAYWGLSKNSDIGEFRRTEVGSGLQKIAAAYFRLDEREKSLSAFERFISFSRHLAEDKADNPAWQSALAAGLLRLANERGAIGDREGQVRDLEEATTIYHKLSDDPSLESFMRDGFAPGHELRAISRVNFGRAVLMLASAKHSIGASLDPAIAREALAALEAALKETPDNTYARNAEAKLRPALKRLVERR